MTGFIYRFALLLSVITFVTCMMNNITLFTCFVRSLMVFIAVLVLFFIGGHLLRIGVQIMEEKKDEEIKPDLYHDQNTSKAQENSKQ